MVKKNLYLLFLLLIPGLIGAQDFNDAPGYDDEHYLALLFPKPLVPVPAEMNNSFAPPALLVQNLVDYAHQFIGTPYHSGGTSANGFDCSGFTQTVFKQIGLQLPRTSVGQANYGEKIELDQVRPGDLLFFTGRNRTSGRVGHVAVVSEVTPEGEIRMIHATIHGGVMVDTPFNTQYYKPRYICARRVLK